jgi:hypothetical protein
VLDCGITLASHWFQLGSPVEAGVGGVYDNVVLHNTSNGNGAAGIGIFAGNALELSSLHSIKIDALVALPFTTT